MKDGLEGQVLFLGSQLSLQMINSQQDLSDKINLVRWEEEALRCRFDLTTIHSLTIDSDTRFKELKEIVHNYNQEQRPDRIRYQQKYIENLFKMLSELTRIPLYEMQVQFLEKIHKWAFNGQGRSQNRGEGYSKSRPGTATTRTRPTTAFTRPPTGVSRPATGKLTTLKTRPQAENFILNKDDPRIDYSKLKPGQQEFYAGIRTLHAQYENPKKRLKEYQRNVFYEDQQDSDVEIIDLDEKEKPAPLKQLKVSEEELINELEAGQEGQEEGVEGVQGAEGAEANVDDIPLEGEQEGGVPQAEQQKQIIDKLKPRLKAYGCPQGEKINKKKYEHQMQEYRNEQYYKERKIMEDKQFAMLQSKWAQGKAKANSQMRRRAQSARVITKKIGIGFAKVEEKPSNTENIISFQNVKPVQVNSKVSRPSTAFRADNPKNREELIKNAFLTGRLTGHVQKGLEQTKSQGLNNIASFTVVGQKPKKKNFQDILRQAQERVAKQAEEEIEQVKETLAKAKVSIGANRIAKSISYYDRQLPEGWVGGVAGMGMIKNPFIRVTKKKKKKKKK